MIFLLSLPLFVRVFLTSRHVALSPPWGGSLITPKGAPVAQCNAFPLPSFHGEEGDEEELRNNLAAHTSVSPSVTQPGEVEAVKSVAYLK